MSTRVVVTGAGVVDGHTSGVTSRLLDETERLCEEAGDRLFANPSKLGDADLKQHAAALGLDASKFNGCFDSHKYKAQVDADIQAGEEAGVSGTPAFFVNGRMLSGAQPFDAFKRLIDEELELKKK